MVFQKLKKLIKKFELRIIHKKKYRDIEKSINYNFLINLKKKNLNLTLENWTKSKSQLKQDLFVLDHFNFKKNGFFCEFGATNGIDLSNTWLLENEFGWKGILAEPNSNYQLDLKKNRKCLITEKCVWKKTGELLEFLNTQDGKFSTISGYQNEDFHKEIRKSNIPKKVETISLYDLLENFDAPKNIDYLSIDTEGSEYDILKNFDLNSYNIEIITVEHNYTENREKIFRYLNENGYKRVMHDVSDFDDWYIK